MLSDLPAETKRIIHELMIALLGEAGAEIRAVSFEETGRPRRLRLFGRNRRRLILRFYIREDTEEVREQISCVLTEYFAQVAEPVELDIEEEVIVSTAPLRELKHLEHLAFARWEGGER
ncbi:MAG: hypothetical protein ACE5GS_16970 [Kiloniellaceae bacterium]